MAQRSTPNAQPLLSSFMTSEIVTLLVGPDSVPIRIHKDLLTQSSPFFKAGFSQKFREGQEGIMSMPEDHPEAVALFAEWLYSSNIRKGSDKTRVMDLYELYILATKLMIVGLMDVAIDRIRDVSYGCSQFVDLDLLVRVYTGTPQGSLPRKFGVEMFLYSMAYSKYSEWLTKKDASQKPERFAYEIFLRDGNSVCKAHKLTREEHYKIWEATRNDDELFHDIFEKLQNNKKDRILNPGWRSSRWPEDERVCEDVFHAHRHKEGKLCPIDEPEDDWIDDTPSVA